MYLKERDCRIENRVLGERREKKRKKRKKRNGGSKMTRCSEDEMGGK